MTGRTDVAKENDLVLLIGRDRKRFILRLTSGAQLQTHRGVIYHDDIIGRPLGREITSHLDYPFLVLEPSTHDLILDLERTTQIMYPKDIGYVLLKMNIKPGSRVVEAGTGSGGLTLALARAVMPTGRVYSYEVRPDVLRLAAKNLDKLGLLPFVELKERDIGEGFDEVDADALFLDLRTPWLYLAQARAALKSGGFFGALLPTANQVVQLIGALPDHGFDAIEVEELLLRPYKAVPARLRPADRMVAHTGYLIFARKVERVPAPEADEGQGTPSEGIETRKGE
ncbi:MAG TPA: tRNA (adenine-N1)-methyltransferase [Anaerolineae bacterium]|nr:tRNA (adenine-N1)-methyltransferase [Anaerolineae bacterium]